MPGFYDPKIICPFYRFTDTSFHEKRNVRCEGVDSLNVMLLFDSAGARRKWQRSYCCNYNGWSRCPYANLVMEHFDK